MKKLAFKKGDKRIIRAWAMYDWANSVYSLTVTTAIFPAYYLAVVSGTDGSDLVDFFGFKINSSSLFAYALSGAFLIAAFISPLLSAIADYTGNKKGFMKFFCYMGAISCSSLYFFNSAEQVEFGIIAFALAGIGFTGSIVFYNAYLPEIVDEDQLDRVSALGFAMGYIGSVILLLANLVIILYPEIIFNVQDKVALLMEEGSINEEEALEKAKDYFTGLSSRIGFLTVGIWWAGFAQITFRRLPKDIYNRKPEGNYLLNGYKELLGVMKQLVKYGVIRYYLVAFFFVSMGVQTIMYMASIFAVEEIHMGTDLLIVVILIIQLVAIPGAFLFSYVSGKQGNIRTLIYSTLIWITVPIFAYYIYGEVEFIMLAFLVGLVMGGVQALSRSTYSKILPETLDHASFFSFYDIAEKVATVLGTLTFGIVNEMTGNMRLVVFPLLLFFIIGLIHLVIVTRKQAKLQEAGKT